MLLNQIELRRVRSLLGTYRAQLWDSPERLQHQHGSPCHVSSSVVPYWFVESGCHSFPTASADSTHWGTRGLPLGTHIGIVTKLTTLEASSVGGVGRRNGSHWCTHWSSLLILREGGVRCLRSGLPKLLSSLLEWLSGARGLL
jgi:hypothetical protein